MRQLMLAAALVIAPTAALADEAAPAAATEEPAGKPVKAPGTIGLAFAFPAGGGPTAGATYFLDKDHAVRADVGLNFALAPDVGVDLSVEAGYRMYQANVGKAHMYLQPGAFLKSTAGKDFFDSKKLELALTGAVGAEYFFLDRFSGTAQTGLALRFANEFDDIALTTGTSALFANFYF